MESIDNKAELFDRDYTLPEAVIREFRRYRNKRSAEVLSRPSVQLKTFLNHPVEDYFKLLKHKIKEDFTSYRFRAKYDLFMLNLEEKHPKVYNSLASLGLPKPY